MTRFWNLSAMRLECGQVTELMKTRPTGDTALLFSMSSCVGRLYYNCPYKSENSQKTRWCTYCPGTSRATGNQLVPYIDFFPRKRNQSTRQENFWDDNHVLMIISSLCRVHLFWSQRPWPHFKHTLKGYHIHFNKGKAHNQIKVTSLKANKGKWTLKKVSSRIQC